MIKPPYIYWLFSPPHLLPTLRDLAVAKLDGGEAERLNFGVAICTIVNPAVIVYYGGSFGPTNDAIKLYLEALLGGNPALAAVAWARIENVAESPRVLRSSHAPTQARIDAGEDVFWNLGTALGHFGLKLYTPPGFP